MRLTATDIYRYHAQGADGRSCSPTEVVDLPGLPLLRADVFAGSVPGKGLGHAVRKDLMA